MKNKNGFTFPEMLLAIACMGIITLLAIPVFASMKLSANEALAVKNMRHYYIAQHTYRAMSGCPPTFGFPHELADAGLIEQEFADVLNYPYYSFYFGYTYDSCFEIDMYGNLCEFELESGPETYNVDGRKQFYMDACGVELYIDQGQDGCPGMVCAGYGNMYEILVCTLGWQMLRF